MGLIDCFRLVDRINGKAGKAGRQLVAGIRDQSQSPPDGGFRYENFGKNRLGLLVAIRPDDRRV